MKHLVFATYKQRGEWVELKFMAAALEHGLRVLKPWGDSLAYDVGLDPSSGRLLRVQVKSTTCRTQYGYLCQFKPNAFTGQYTLGQLDFFAAYVIPQEVWYIIPAATLLDNHQFAATLHPINPKHPARYRYECYKEAWPLLTQRAAPTPNADVCVIPKAGCPTQARFWLEWGKK